MNIYAGNLSWDVDDQELRKLFEAHGAVDKASVLTDRDSGRSRGFGFVEMPNDTEAKAAIEALNGKEIDGRALTINEAKPREPRRSGGGGGGRNFGGGGGGDRRGRNDRGGNNRNDKGRDSNRRW